MRGISEINEANEHPHHRSSEMFGVGRHTEGSDVNRSFESNMADKLRREGNGGERSPNKGETVVAGILADLFIGAAIESILTPRTLADRSRLNDKGSRFLGMDGIHSAIDGEPPFLKFWQKLNDERAARGEPEAGYHTAKEAFTGGPTPDGALTFIGKDYDGLRAVPAKPHDGHRTYHGEFRQVSDAGTIWRTVHSTHGPIAYATAEAALYGARHAKLHSEAQHA